MPRLFLRVFHIICYGQAIACCNAVIPAARRRILSSFSLMITSRRLVSLSWSKPRVSFLFEIRCRVFVRVQLVFLCIVVPRMANRRKMILSGGQKDDISFYGSVIMSLCVRIKSV